MKVLRTPEERFAGLPGFGYPPRYADVGGVRLAYVETGPAGREPVRAHPARWRCSAGSCRTAKDAYDQGAHP